MNDDDYCFECDRPDPECACEDRLRCSCGLPALTSCVCAGTNVPNFALVTGERP